MRAFAAERGVIQHNTHLCMIEYPTRTWDAVRTFFRQLSESNAAFAPMHHAVEQLARSRYAGGLHPVTSMHTLRLYQHDAYSSFDEELRLDYEDGAFVVRHRTGTTPDPRFAIAPVAGVWTTRGSDPMALIDRAFHHLRWFVEYESTEHEDH
jgi:hypothetical protein